MKAEGIQLTSGRTQSDPSGNERVAPMRSSEEAAPLSAATSSDGAEGEEPAEPQGATTAPEPEEPPVMSWRLALVILTISAVLMSLSYTMLIPFLPMYLIEELHVPRESVNLWSGLIFSVSFLIAGIMAPIWGAMADKKSRKLMAVRSAVLLALAYALAGMVQNEWQLLAVRCLQGFASGLWPACLALMSSYVPKERVGVSLGIMQGGMSAGVVLGPLIGGFLADAFGMRATFYLGASALTVITFLIIFLIKEPKRKKVVANEPQRPKTNLLKIPVIRRMLITAAVVQLTVLLQQPMMALYVEQLQGNSDRIVLVTGLLFSIVGIASVIASPLWGVAGQRYGFRPALYTALAGTALFQMLQCIPDSLFSFGAVRFLNGLMLSGVFPAINAILTNNTAPEDRGRIFGYSFSFQQAGSVIGPILGSAMTLVVPISAVLFCAGLFLVPLVAYLIWNRPHVESSMKGVAVKFNRR